MSNSPQTLGTYIKKILDVNKDGQITFKDFLSLFPNSAIAIAVLFVDLVVLVAEYRVWDVGMQISGDPFKAIGFVLISAVPFYIGQLFWLYPHATFWQKIIAVGFAAGGLYTSAEFGLADLSQSYDVAWIIAMLIRLTIAYIVAALVYILIDPNIKAWRAMVTAQGAVDMELKFQNMTRQMLAEWKKTKEMERETIDLFDGDEQAVITQLNELRGKGKRPAYAKDSTVVRESNNTPVNAPQKPQDAPKWYSLTDFLEEANLTQKDILHFGDYGKFAQFASQKLDISGKNMKAIWRECGGQFANPTQAAPNSNHGKR